MKIIFREIKVTNGDGITIPPSRIGDFKMSLRDDGSYICWMEYSCDVGAITNEA